MTEAGRRFVERIAAGVDELDHAVKTAGIVAAGESSHLRIGVHALIPSGFLVELIGRYRGNHPGIVVGHVNMREHDQLYRVHGRGQMRFRAI